MPFFFILLAILQFVFASVGMADSFDSTTLKRISGVCPTSFLIFGEKGDSGEMLMSFQLQQVIYPESASAEVATNGKSVSIVARATNEYLSCFARGKIDNRVLQGEIELQQGNVYLTLRPTNVGTAIIEVSESFGEVLVSSGLGIAVQ